MNENPTYITTYLCLCYNYARILPPRNDLDKYGGLPLPRDTQHHHPLGLGFGPQPNYWSAYGMIIIGELSANITRQDISDLG